MEQADPRKPSTDSESDNTARPVPVIRTGVAGVLMGLANLVPGVSGGTMVLVMGLYDEFVSSVADITRLRLTRRNVFFIGLLTLIAGLTIASCSGMMSRLVTTQRSAMYSLFIGMTLGGAPLLYKMVRPLKAASVAGVIVGLSVMIVIAVTRPEEDVAVKPETETKTSAVIVEPHYARDVAAGALGMSAMVLPGISGAYMLLVLGRYETVLAAVSQATKYATSLGAEGAPGEFLQVIVPVAIGALLSLVGLSNLLKWMLHHHSRATLGFLLGVLLGSVIGIWPFDGASGTGNYAIGCVLAVVGFVATMLLSRIKA